MSNSAQTLSGKRIESLLDDNSFVEVGSYVTARNTDFNMTAQETAADGVITGYGTIEGNLVYVYSQDASVMGGSIGEMHAKKISGIYKMAMKMGAPVIGLLDCSGLRLQEATDALDGFGQMYLEQTLASGADLCGIWKLRRRYGGIFCYRRFCIYGRGRQVICEFSQCPGWK